MVRMRRVIGLPPSTASVMPRSVTIKPTTSGTSTGDTTTTSRDRTTRPLATISGMSLGLRMLTATSTRAAHRARKRKIDRMPASSASGITMRSVSHGRRTLLAGHVGVAQHVLEGEHSGLLDAQPCGPRAQAHRTLADPQPRRRLPLCESLGEMVVDLPAFGAATITEFQQQAHERLGIRRGIVSGDREPCRRALRTL